VRDALDIRVRLVARRLIMALDPVCGMTVDPAKAAGHLEHKGRTYHFCSKHCLHAFSADPEKYLTPKGAKHAQPAKEGVRYTCPMHPEIVQIGPGSCPKCGMTLVPMEGGVRGRFGAARPDAPPLGERGAERTAAPHRDGADAGIRGAIRVLQVCRAASCHSRGVGGAVGPSSASSGCR